MNTAWRVEYTRILTLVASILLIGTASGYWVVAVLLPSTVYIGWTLVQIRRFEHWFRHGANTEYAPNANGIWQVIVQHIHRVQKRNKQQKQCADQSQAIWF